MKTPEQWLAKQIGDRPDDFSDEDRREALEFIRAVQRDAAPFTLRQILYLIVINALTTAAVWCWLR